MTLDKGKAIKVSRNVGGILIKVIVSKLTKFSYHNKRTMIDR